MATSDVPTERCTAARWAPCHGALVWCLPRLSFRAAPALLRDVSAAEARLLTERSAAPGDVLLLLLSEWPVRRLARVVHVGAEPASTWVLGCAFAVPLSKAELAAVREEFPAW